jgi:hypothetical protein
LIEVVLINKAVIVSLRSIDSKKRLSNSSSLDYSFVNKIITKNGKTQVKVLAVRSLKGFIRVLLPA